MSDTGGELPKADEQAMVSSEPAKMPNVTSETTQRRRGFLGRLAKTAAAVLVGAYAGEHAKQTSGQGSFAEAFLYDDSKDNDTLPPPQSTPTPAATATPAIPTPTVAPTPTVIKTPEATKTPPTPTKMPEPKPTVTNTATTPENKDYPKDVLTKQELDNLHVKIVQASRIELLVRKQALSEDPLFKKMTAAQRDLVVSAESPPRTRQRLY